MINLPPGFRIVPEEDVEELNAWRTRRERQYRPDVERRIMEMEANGLTDSWGIYIQQLEDAIETFCEADFCKAECVYCPLYEFSGKPMKTEGDERGEDE